METIFGKWELLSIQVYHPTHGWEHFIDTPGVEWEFHPDGVEYILHDHELKIRLRHA